MLFTDYNSAEREVQTLRSIDMHNNIVSYEEEFLHHERGTLEPTYFMCIVMEFCPGGDLCDYIRRVKEPEDESEKPKDKLSLDEVLAIFIDICQAIKHIHRREIVHRDLKSPNIFQGADGVFKLGDFGLSVMNKHKGRKSTLREAAVGTEAYQAPEVMNKKPQGKAADIWCLGLILIELCTLTPVWEFDDFCFGVLALTGEMAKFIDKLDPEYAPIKSLLNNMLNKDPKARFSITDVLKHKKIKRTVEKTRVGRRHRKTSVHEYDPTPDKQGSHDSQEFVRQTSQKRLTERF
jgi:NIMA (never in mitosis gene a)-related kinase